MTGMALRKCVNGGLRLNASGRLDTCCDPCEITIDLERRRIQSLPSLSNFLEGDEGLLVVDNTFDETQREYYVRHVFAYTYYDENAGWLIDVLEYFDCHNCEKTVLYAGNDGFLVWPYRFFPLPDSCKGCIIKMKTPTLLATINASGPHEAPVGIPSSHAVWTWTNTTTYPVYVYYAEDNTQSSIYGYGLIDNYGQFQKDGKIPTEEINIDAAIVYPNETVVLYCVNELYHGPGHYNPWEMHAKVYMAEITCDPCEVAIYEATTEDGVAHVYGAGYYTGGSSEQPYQSAYLTDILDTLTLWGFTCDTCEKVRLWTGYAGDSPEIPYREDETACDGEGEVQ